MKKFGILKTKLLTKLTESYAKENKAEIKNILTIIKENNTIVVDLSNFSNGLYLISFFKNIVKFTITK